ncbi:unnamed protein product, partial [Mesorhabditis belari]|uniref:G-protein coupled receptors family 1 profile domain-containing protein n=1 Tax=Mesorhabditis belari TaxID=2138241 RepID=A0AAF3EEB0_9BILA
MEGTEKPMIMEIGDIDKYCPRHVSPNDSHYRTAPFSHSCLTEIFDELKRSLRRYSQLEAVTYTTIYIIISILAVIGNGLVIYVICRKKSMRTNRNVLILNLALSNLVLAVTNIPFLWLPSIEFEFPYSSIFCKLANVLPGMNVYCSTLTISVMAIDRYYSVKRLSLMSSSRRHLIRAAWLSILIWIVSFILSLPLLVSYDTTMLFVFKDLNVFEVLQDSNVTMRSYGWKQCQITSGSRNDLQLVMSVMQAAFLYVIPLIVLSIFNVKLTRFLKHNANQMSKNRLNRSRDLLTPTDRSVSERTPECLSPIPCKQNRSRPGTAEMASKKRRSRTTGLLVAMAGSYAILWLPFTVVTMLLDLGILSGSSDEQTTLIEHVDQSCKVLSMLSVCVNPFLYGFLNTNFRQEFIEIYYQWIRCTPKKPNRFSYTSGVAMEYSSVGYPNRNPTTTSRPHSRIESMTSPFYPYVPPSFPILNTW